MSLLKKKIIAVVLITAIVSSIISGVVTIHLFTGGQSVEEIKYESGPEEYYYPVGSTEIVDSCSAENCNYSVMVTSVEQINRFIVYSDDGKVNFDQFYQVGDMKALNGVESGDTVAIVGELEGTPRLMSIKEAGSNSPENDPVSKNISSKIVSVDNCREYKNYTKVCDYTVEVTNPQGAEVVGARGYLPPLPYKVAKEQGVSVKGGNWLDYDYAVVEGDSTETLKITDSKETVDEAGLSVVVYNSTSDGIETEVIYATNSGDNDE